MSDLLMEGDTKITSSTVFDNLIWREGSLEVYPEAEVIMNGDFIFYPTESLDPIGKIYRAIKSRLAIESGKGRVFESFFFYDNFRPATPIFFPCLIIHNAETTETSSAFFGGGYIERIPIVIELAFKRDKNKITADGTLSGKALSEYYLFETRNLLDDIIYEGDAVRIGQVDYDNTFHNPTETNQTLFGFTLNASIEFKTEE